MFLVLFKFSRKQVLRFLREPSPVGEGGLLQGKTDEVFIIQMTPHPPLSWSPFPTGEGFWESLQKSISHTPEGESGGYEIRSCGVGRNTPKA